MDLVDSKSELSQGITKRSNNIRREGKKINQCHIRSWKPGLDVIPESTGWGFRIMPRPDQINDDGDETARQNLLERLLGCVQRCQIRFGGRKSELATEQVRAVGEVCSALEAVLEHGLLRPSSSLLSKLGGSASANDGSCWPLIKQHLSKSELDRFYLLKNVNCDRGRCRAWLRAALNEHSLERHLAAIIAEPAKISGLYHGWSFLLDEERASILPSMSAGLSSILFAINIDSPALNEPKNQTERDDEESEGNLLAADKSSSFSSSSSSHKKKRKVLPQLVNFDEHSLKEDENDDESQNPSNLVPAGRQGRSREKKGGETNHASSSSGPNHNPHHQVSQENPDPEDDEEIYSGRSRTSSLSTEDESKNGGKSKTINRPPLSLAKLTPMKNSGVGALIPVGSGDDVLDGQSEDSLSIRSYGDESDYASACSKVGVAGAAKKPAHSLMARKDSPSANAGAARSLNNNALLSADAAKDTRRGEGGGSSQGSSSTLSREDLKQALLSVMERKEELQNQCGVLKEQLEKESNALVATRQELSEANRKYKESEEKLECRVRTLARENELLKHQLKKYVGAVQKLRDGPQAYETLAHLEQRSAENQPGNNHKYVDYHYEASEYEKKLIQVAEMHGELIEFNEHLQRNVQIKDAVIMRMREELVDLRGPLPNDPLGPESSGGAGNRRPSEDMSDSASVSSLSGASSSRVSLLHIWIPSVFLSGSGAKTHHVYQVYLRIKDEEWNIYRRYSDFYALHRELKKADSQVATYDFPPKKTVGNKADKVVEERRKRLQAYLRRIVNLLVATNPALSAKPDKESVLLLMPFFSESAYLPEDQQGASSPASAPVISPAARTSPGHFRGQGRSQSQGRSIFNRRRSTNQAAVTPQLAL